jgi:hypothetical protein
MSVFWHTVACIQTKVILTRNKPDNMHTACAVTRWSAGVARFCAYKGRGIEQLPAWRAWGVPLLHKPTPKGTSQHPCTQAEAKIG